MPGAAEGCIVSATIQDPSGQIFANGTWQLILKDAPNVPGPSRNNAVVPTLPLTRYFSGNLDGTGSFSQSNVVRNDFISPAGSTYTLIVAPNASSNAYQVDLNVTGIAFNASAAINAVVSNIFVQAFPVAHAYKDSEVLPVPGSGGVYYDVTLKVFKIWDTATAAWITVNFIGQLPITKTATASNWLRSYDSITGLFTASQPTEADIAGLLADLALLAPLANPNFSGTVTGVNLLFSAAVTAVIFAANNIAAAQSGRIRLVNTDQIKSRNAANNADLNLIQMDGTNKAVVGDTSGVSLQGPLFSTTLTQAGSGNRTNLLDSQDTLGNLTGNGTDQTVYTFTIPANTIQAGKGLRLRFFATNNNNVAVTYKFTLGATTALTLVSGAVAATNFSIVLDIFNNTAVQNAQVWTEIAYDANSVLSNGSVTSAENFANALTFKVTANEANPNTITPKKWFLEIIQ